MNIRCGETTYHSFTPVMCPQCEDTNKTCECECEEAELIGVWCVDGTGSDPDDYEGWWERWLIGDKEFKERDLARLIPEFAKIKRELAAMVERADKARENEDKWDYACYCGESRDSAMHYTGGL